MEVCWALLKEKKKKNSRFFEIEVTTQAEQEAGKKKGREMRMNEKQKKEGVWGELGAKEGVCLKKCDVVKGDISRNSRVGQHLN